MAEKKKRKTRKIILLSAVFIAVFIISLVFDKQIINAIQAVRTSGLDAFFGFFLFLEKGFVFYPLIVAATAALLAWRKKKAILPFIISTGIAALVSFLLKNAVARPRPFSSMQNSFPSGHATIAFAPLAFLKRKIFGWISIAWLVFACLLAFTRIWFGLHYLSDVIAGAAIGYGIALAVKRISKLK